MELREAMRTARAVRRYTTDPVPDDVLARCLEAATWGPSGSNRQGWRFVVLRSPEARAVLGPAYRKGWEDMAGAYGTAPDPSDDSRRARLLRTMAHFVEHFEDIPVYVLFCLQARPDRGPILSDGASVYPAVQNFLLAARDEGLGAVMTTWFQYCDAELRDVAGIPDDWLLAALVPVGWPAGGHGAVKRRPLAELASLDRWETPFA